MTSTTRYEVYAIRYATHDRQRSDNFIQRDPHDGPMPMDFFVWLLRSQDRDILIDTGFNSAAAAARHRTLLPRPRAIALCCVARSTPCARWAWTPPASRTWC